MCTSRMDERISLYLLLSRWVQALPVKRTPQDDDFFRSLRTALWTFPNSCLLAKTWSSSSKLRIWAGICLCSIPIDLLEHSFRKSKKGEWGTRNGKSGSVMCQGRLTFCRLSVFELKRFMLLSWHFATNHSQEHTYFANLRPDIIHAFSHWR